MSSCVELNDSMKNFLNKLAIEGKLRIVQPSEEISTAYISKSHSNLNAAKILLDSAQLEECVTLAYYAMYNCVLALLFRCGIKSENHGASIIILKKIFGEPKLESMISFGKKERIDKQYYIDFSLTKKDSDDMLIMAEEFIIQCQIVINKLTHTRIDEIRLKLAEELR